MYVQYVCVVCMCSMYVQYVCTICMYKSGLGIMRTLRLKSSNSNFPSYFVPSFLHHLSFNQQMFSRPKTARRKLPSDQHAAIIVLREGGKSFDEIVRQMKLARSTVIIIIHRINRKANAFSVIKKRFGQSAKLNERQIRALIRHVELNSHDNFHVFATPSKSEKKLCRTTIRKYLKCKGYFRFRAKKKSYLSPRHKAERLI